MYEKTKREVGDMTFPKILRPDICAKSVYDINYAELRSRGITGLIFDIDGTLVPHGMPPESETAALFEKLGREGFSAVLLTDNDLKRAKTFALSVGVPYICDAEKPKKRGFIEAMRMLGTESDKTAVVGDRLLSDIYGANRCGIFSVFVEYRKNAGETGVGKRRMFEKMYIKLCRRIGVL